MLKMIIRMEDSTGSLVYRDNGHTKDYGHFGNTVNTLKKQAYDDLRRFFKRHHFSHHQGSGYISDTKLGWKRQCRIRKTEYIFSNSGSLLLPLFVYARARIGKFAAKAECGPRGEQGRKAFLYSIIIGNYATV